MQVGFVPPTFDLIPGGVEAETRQTLENIGAILEAAGLTFDHVVKTTVLLKVSTRTAKQNVPSRVFS